MTAEERSKEYVDNYLKNSREFPFSADCQRKALIKVDLNRVERAFEDGYIQAIQDMVTAKENYPIGSDSSDAPWNQSDLPEEEIEVLVSITLSKIAKIKVSDYTVVDEGKDEDGDYFRELDFSNCDLKSAVNEQVYLPHQLNVACSLPNVHVHPTVKEDFDGWNVDDFEVVLN